VYRRHVSQWLIVITSLALAVLFSVVSFELDQRKHTWLNVHPVTANLIAGVLALPLSFLVVNLAAQWALDWSARRQWRVVRAVAVAGLEDTWNTMRGDYAYRYSLEGTNSATDRKLEESMTSLDADWSGRIAAAADPTGSTATPSTALDELYENIWAVEAYTGQLQSAGVGLREEVYRRRLVMHVLPRFEDARFGLTLIAQAQKAIDVLVDLEISWELFSDVYGGPFGYFIRDADTSDTAWPLKLSVNDMERYQERLEHIRQLFAVARRGFDALDDLASALREPPSAPRRRSHWPRRRTAGPAGCPSPAAPSTAQVPLRPTRRPRLWSKLYQDLSRAATKTPL
jgi:hypothetical protein